MRRLSLMTAFVAALLPMQALAASNPISGAAENFITFRPAEGIPDPVSYGGTSDCRSAPANAWWGRFAGGEANSSSDGDGGGYNVYSDEGCFPSRAHCLGWLRAMKSQFGFHPIYNQCQAGYQPGAAVPPWWSNASD